MKVYPSFFKSRITGIVTMPDFKKERSLGHAMLIIGFDAEKRLFTVQNSYGMTWGARQRSVLHPL